MGALLFVISVVMTIAMIREAASAPPPPPPPPPGGPGGPPPPAVPGLGVPLPGLGQNELGRWKMGQGAFLQPVDPPGGLGPVFTENACAKCHNAGAPGGAGDQKVTRIGRIVNGQFDPMLAFGGPAIQDKGIGKFNGVNFVGEVVPAQATIVAKRRTSPTFGLGLVDAVPDNVFVAIAQHEEANTPLTAGAPSYVTDPVTGQNRVGKFGWKAQQPSLLAFTADANVNELGVTSPVFPDENCPQGNCALLSANPARSNPNDHDLSVIQQQTDFMTFLAPPPRGPVGANEQAGATIFNQIGCANCHLPMLQTAANPVQALSGVAFSPFSDFLLHDMGRLGDGIVQNQAGPTQMRTAPLWGLRFQGSFLHDGRATSPDQAIRAHAGQATAAQAHYAGLSNTQRAQLLAFLNSL